MKHLLLIISFLFLLQACNTTPSKPTPFEADKAVGVPQGCHDLKVETEKYNKEHPDKPKRKPDC